MVCLSPSYNVLKSTEYWDRPSTFFGIREEGSLDRVPILTVFLDSYWELHVQEC